MIAQLSSGRLSIPVFFWWRWFLTVGIVAAHLCVVREQASRQPQPVRLMMGIRTHLRGPTRHGTPGPFVAALAVADDRPITKNYVNSLMSSGCVISTVMRSLVWCVSTRTDRSAARSRPMKGLAA